MPSGGPRTDHRLRRQLSQTGLLSTGSADPHRRFPARARLLENRIPDSPPTWRCVLPRCLFERYNHLPQGAALTTGTFVSIGHPQGVGADVSAINPGLTPAYRHIQKKQARINVVLRPSCIRRLPSGSGCRSEVGLLPCTSVCLSSPLPQQGGGFLCFSCFSGNESAPGVTSEAGADDA